MEDTLAISRVERALEELRRGRMVILVDDEDRENEGDLVLAAEHATPEAINFMARNARGLICLSLTAEQVKRLGLSMMVQENESRFSTAFTVSIEAARGVTTGISAADRAATVLTAISPQAVPEDVVRPGHIFPLRARPGGVLVRTGQTEGSVDLARLAGLNPAGVICEVMNDDGTMARLPDLEIFAKEHGLLIGTIADLIHYRSRNESLINRVGRRELATPYGRFDCHLFRDRSGGAHMALVKGSWRPGDEIPVRVHEPFSAIDLLDSSCAKHSWPLPLALANIEKRGQGVAVLLNCGEPPDHLVAQLMTHEDPCEASARRPVDLRTYGVGAQILRELGVTRMQLLGQPRRMPSMTGYGLEVSSFITTADAA